MVNYFVCNDISNLIDETSSTLESLNNVIEDSTAKPYFIYAYSLFESTITEILRYYLKAFPYKIDKNIVVGKEIVLSSCRTSDIIDIMIDQNIRRYSCKSLYEYMQFFVSIQDIEMVLDRASIDRIASLRNSIVHDDIKNILVYKHTNNGNEYGNKVSIKQYKNFMHQLVAFLKDYMICMEGKYSEYSLEKLARTIWNNIFSTPLLEFDSVWEFHSEGYLQIRDVEDLKERAHSICRSEHILLAIFLQQYNLTLNTEIHGYEEMPSLVSLDTINKNKLVELIDFFDTFPLLYCGERLC